MRKPQSDMAKLADRHVGARLRERRIMLGLTQQELAGHLGITYQQLHKYEQAINRISASRLYDVARAIGVPIGFFYDGLGEGGGAVARTGQRRHLEISRVFGDIQEARLQTALLDVTRALAAAAQADGDQALATSSASISS